jgi:hypothetical protein
LSGDESAQQQEFEPRVRSSEEIEMDGHGSTIVRTRANLNLTVNDGNGDKGKTGKNERPTQNLY